MTDTAGLVEMVGKPEFIVIMQQAWMNATGFGINYGWDGVRFDTRKKAIRHGLRERGSDDFNIGEVTGDQLTWFGWMDERINEDDATMAEIADAIGLEFATLRAHQKETRE